MERTHGRTGKCSISQKVLTISIASLGLIISSLTGCKTTETAQQTIDSYYAPGTTYENRPISNPPVENRTHNFARGNLPLGIGAKLNLTMSESPEPAESSGASNFFDKNIKPLRRGKLLSRTPMQMNYAIMPDSGEAFYHSGGLDNGSIKSNYDFQIGMSRHVYKASDFLNADFWLAKGKYNPNKAKKNYRNDPAELNPYRTVDPAGKNAASGLEIDESRPLDPILFSDQ